MLCGAGAADKAALSLSFVLSSHSSNRLLLLIRASCPALLLLLPPLV